MEIAIHSEDKPEDRKKFQCYRHLILFQVRRQIRWSDRQCPSQFGIKHL